ncbi:MAG: hypothetical protein AAF799_47425 [Myxococcota bacterium]
MSASSRRRSFAPWAVLAAGLWAASGCPTNEGESPESTPPPDSTLEATNTTEAPTSTGAADSTGPGWPLPTDDELLTCVRTCEGPWDCCPPNTQGLCPGPAYPYNYMCIDGLCVTPPCVADSDCLDESEQCVSVRGAPRCVRLCDGPGDDDPCPAIESDQTCSGVDDEGQTFCFAHCDNTGVFCGNTTCDSATGECVCSSKGQCQSNWDCV